MQTGDRPPTPHPVTDTILMGKKIVKTKAPKPSSPQVIPVIEEPPQKISH